VVLRSSLQEQPEKKQADLDQAVRLAPDDPATLRARGVALAELGKPDLALADLKKAIQSDPTHAETYDKMAEVLARLNKYDEALAAIDKARELDPQSLKPFVLKAQVHAMQRKFDAAVADLNEALTLDNGNVPLLLLRAGVYQEQGDKQKAQADLDQALKLKPNMPLVIRTRASFLAQNDRLDEAVAELEKLVKRDPKDAATLLQLGLMYGAKKNSPKAIETYTALLALIPDSWQALRCRGDAYLNVGRQADAVADYEKAFKLEPKDDGVLNNLAWVLCTSPDDKLRNGRRAIELATEACKLTEYAVPHILSTLAAAYAETGDFDNAVKWAAKAVEIADKEPSKELPKELSKENDNETKAALKKEFENYKAKKPTRELLSETQGEKKSDGKK
jgi:tetratricopeptide (TPR) repeat protein